MTLGEGRETDREREHTEFPGLAQCLRIRKCLNGEGSLPWKCSEPRHLLCLGFFFNPGSAGGLACVSAIPSGSSTPVQDDSAGTGPISCQGHYF